MNIGSYVKYKANENIGYICDVIKKETKQYWFVGNDLMKFNKTSIKQKLIEITKEEYENYINKKLNDNNLFKLKNNIARNLRNDDFLRLASQEDLEVINNIINKTLMKKKN